MPWPERDWNVIVSTNQFTGLGYVPWPEHHQCLHRFRAEFTGLGYVPWPEPCKPGKTAHFSLLDWDMCPGRNFDALLVSGVPSLLDWDMCPGRNKTCSVSLRVVVYWIGICALAGTLSLSSFSPSLVYWIGICALAGTKVPFARGFPLVYWIGICALAGTHFLSSFLPRLVYWIGICALAGTLSI